jgi:hypothetical protein
MVSLVERYADRVVGMVSCFDRVVITGTLPTICHVRAMEGHLRAHSVRLFDYPRWAEPLRDQLRANAEKVVQAAGLEIEFIRRNSFRKEERIKEIVAQRGDHPGLVHVFSAMEPCPSYKPWYDKRTRTTSLRPTEAKCLHYYFYFIDPEFGLCYLRVPTWAPFRLQFYFNGHNLLASRLREAGIDCSLRDNAFVHVGDFERAQQLAEVPIDRLHRLLDRLARQYCPVVAQFGGYHWSLMQVEYATDILWQRPTDLAPLYDVLVPSVRWRSRHRFPYPGRRHPDQARHGESGNQDVRQVWLDLAGGDHSQRRDLLQAPPTGGTQRRHQGEQDCAGEEVDLQPPGLG